MPPLPASWHSQLTEGLIKDHASEWCTQGGGVAKRRDPASQLPWSPQKPGVTLDVFVSKDVQKGFKRWSHSTAHSFCKLLLISKNFALLF